jgi:predicted negative regulator of RcsB-dependent stress response
MATLDLEEQEQLDQLKHFWRQYGNLITWTLILVLTGYAAWNGWQLWQRKQSAAASGMYAELERAAAAGDAERAGKVFGDLKTQYPRTTFAEQGGLLAAQAQFDKGQLDAAQASLGWVAEQGSEAEYQAIARLRLAALLLDAKKLDEAAKQLAVSMPKPFEGLAADRRGDVLQAQGKPAEAVAAYQQAYKALDEQSQYRRIVEAKLMALGAAPAAGSTAASGATP